MAFGSSTTSRTKISSYGCVPLACPPSRSCIVSSNDVIEVETRYDDVCALNTICNITITVNDAMKQPVYMYYKLTNYYQNHRRYVQSWNDAQLQGQTVSYSDVSDCSPADSQGGSSSNSAVFYPCGLIARSFFNDTFQLLYPNKTFVPLQKEGIAWDSDIDHKFKNPNRGANGVRVIDDFQDEDFIVWMRTAGLPTFKKLYRIIKTDLDSATYTVVINNYYPTGQFSGNKYVVLSTVSWMGGKNPFLGYAYIVVGGLCFVLAVGFGLRHLIKPRKLGDVRYLNWEKWETWSKAKVHSGVWQFSQPFFLVFICESGYCFFPPSTPTQ